MDSKSIMMECPLCFEECNVECPLCHGEMEISVDDVPVNKETGEIEFTPEFKELLIKSRVMELNKLSNRHIIWTWSYPQNFYRQLFEYKDSLVLFGDGFPFYRFKIDKESLKYKVLQIIKDIEDFGCETWKDVKVGNVYSHNQMRDLCRCLK